MAINKTHTKFNKTFTEAEHKISKIYLPVDDLYYDSSKNNLEEFFTQQVSIQFDVFPSGSNEKLDSYIVKMGLKEMLDIYEMNGDFIETIYNGISD